MAIPSALGDGLRTRNQCQFERDDEITSYRRYVFSKLSSGVRLISAAFARPSVITHLHVRPCCAHVVTQDFVNLINGIRTVLYTLQC